MIGRWKNAAALADALRARAAQGRNAVLSPETARLIAFLIDRPQEPNVRHPDAAWRIDLYKEGSCVYRLRRDGEIDQIAAWARSTSVARASFVALQAAYPNESFSQRRGSWVEAGE